MTVINSTQAQCLADRMWQINSRVYDRLKDRVKKADRRVAEIFAFSYPTLVLHSFADGWDDDRIVDYVVQSAIDKMARSKGRL